MFKNIFFAIGTLVILVVGISVLPLDKINWGRISILPAATITVSGTAQSNVANQISSFGATVTVTNPDKDTAVNAVNTKMTALLTSLKNFGIPDADIKTQSVNIYQMPTSPMPVPQAQTMMYPVPPIRSGNGDWQASNSITITLRDVSKSSALSDLLNNSGATNVYGPNLTTDPNSTSVSADLLSKAVADAKAKAESIAKSGGQTLGKMINVQENGTNSGIYPQAMMLSKDAGSSGSPVQPGTSTFSTSVTVTYELK